MMNLSKILMFLLIGFMWRVSGAEMPDVWYQEKDQSWQQARIQYPQSAYPGPFKTRMVEIDEWARTNNPNLHYNSNKPLIIAQMVQREIDDAAARETEVLAQQAQQAQQRTQERTQMLAKFQEQENALRLSQQQAQPSKPTDQPDSQAKAAPRSTGDTGHNELSGSDTTAIWFVTIINVVLASLVAWGLHWFIRPRHGATSASTLGRKWAAWIVAVGTITMLPPFFRKLDGDSFALWAIGVVGWGVFSFFIGWIIGLFKFRQKGGQDSSPPPTPTMISPPDTAVLMCAPSTSAISHPPLIMNTNEFEVEIPEGKALGNGYVEMRHNTQYSLNLKNYRWVSCDAEVTIDGIHVGTWRIESRNEIHIERPVHDTGHFTFFEVGTEEAGMAGIAKNSDNGLISVTFKPKKESHGLNTAPLPGSELRAGATGLTGESRQRFSDASEIEHDMARAFTIHLRLVSRRPDIRPLAPRSTPIPPPID